MVNTTDDLVILVSPVFLILLGLILLFLLFEHLFEVHGAFRILSLILTLALIVFSILSNVKYQELVLVLLGILFVEVLFLRLTASKEEEK